MKIVALLFSKALVEVNIIGLEGREVDEELKFKEFIRLRMTGRT